MSVFRSICTNSTLETQASGLTANLVGEIKSGFSAPALVENGAPNGFKLYEAGDILFFYTTDPNGGPSYIQRASSYSGEPQTPHQRFGQLSAYLLAGGAPDLLLSEMRVLRQQVTLNSEELYLYGLAAELAGQPVEAVSVYWQIWREFPDSAIANLVRYKLVLLP